MQWTRIASGLACMLFAAWFMAEWDGDEFPFEPLIGFLLSFPAWIFVESKANKSISLAQPTLHPNDVTLGNQLRAIFTPETRQFLRDHNFGVPYEGARLDAVQTIASDWRGAEFEFENAELDNLSAEISRLSELILQKLAIYSGPADSWPEGYFSIPTQEERGSDWFSDQTRSHVKEVNEIASDIVGNLDKFEKAFRQLSPDSFIANREVE